jgi:hypothetical protein
MAAAAAVYEFEYNQKIIIEKKKYQAHKTQMRLDSEPLPSSAPSFALLR